MIEALRRICELQPSYSADNTPAMQERGAKLRSEIKPAIEAMRPFLAKALAEFGDDFHVDASDGIGRKTELPWVRFCSSRMSPRPTEGFYCVIHFSTDGSAVHVTVGCGSSRFHKGSSVPLPEAELDKETSWARKIIIESFGALAPFNDQPDFGAKRKLPISFQRATALCMTIPFEKISQTDFEQVLELAAVRLRAIYQAQAVGRDLSQADQIELELNALMNPERIKNARQGYGLSAAARRAVELWAMKLATQWLKNNGYSTIDCSEQHPFDIEAKRGQEIIKVEVKGTTSDRADAILMTHNEVDLHVREKGTTALIIVSRIRLSKDGDEYDASGGDVEVLIGWDISKWMIEPTAFRLSRQS